MSPIPAAGVVITPENYNRIVRLLEHKIPVKLEFDIKAQFGEKEEESFNIIGEIPGGKKKDEIVMIGGHFDSWHGATGATDNGTGSSVAIEAMRILKSPQYSDGPHGADRAVERRGRRAAGVHRICEESLRGSRGHEGEAGVRKAGGLFQ